MSTNIIDKTIFFNKYNEDCITIINKLNENELLKDNKDNLTLLSLNNLKKILTEDNFKIDDKYINNNNINSYINYNLTGNLEVDNLPIVIDEYNNNEYNIYNYKDLDQSKSLFNYICLFNLNKDLNEDIYNYIKNIYFKFLLIENCIKKNIDFNSNDDLDDELDDEYTYYYFKIKYFDNNLKLITDDNNNEIDTGYVIDFKVKYHTSDDVKLMNDISQIVENINNNKLLNKFNNNFKETFNKITTSMIPKRLESEYNYINKIFENVIYKYYKSMDVKIDDQPVFEEDILDDPNANFIKGFYNLYKKKKR